MRLPIHAIFLSLLTINIYANVRLPRLISDGMVLQRDKPLKIWGWSEPGEKISVSFYGDVKQTVASNEGKWQVELAAKPAGGPFEMLIKGKNEIKISNILLGDVWLCGGQSNMDYTLKQLDFFENEIKTKEFDEIRQFKVERFRSDTLCSDVTSKGWLPATPENLGEFSATAYFFAKEIYYKHKIPIGLIGSNWGGSPAEVWMDEQSLIAFPEIKSAYQELESSIKEREKSIQSREAKIPQYIQKAKDMDEGNGKYQSVKFNFSKWSTVMLPEKIKEKDVITVDGTVWLRKTVDIPSEWQGKDLVFEATSIDDADDTWVNGELIGSTNQHDKIRHYTIPSKFTKSGKLFIAIRLIDYGGDCGVTGNFRLGYNNTFFELAGKWHYNVTYNLNTFSEYTQPDWGRFNNWRPSKCYNGMVNPLLNYSIKGAIWYQGEANASRAYQYRTLFPALIKNWREKFNQGDFPFLYVQLANFLKPDTMPKDDPWPELREAQTFALKALPNIGMALAIDLGEINDIHPKNKADVGKRLALQASKLVYNDKKIVANGPYFQSVKFEGERAIITFKNEASKLVARNGELKGFALAGEDKKYYYAKGKIIDANTVEIYCEKVLSPLYVRYAWANNPIDANLYNSAGLPACPFRTDEFEGVTYQKYKID